MKKILVIANHFYPEQFKSTEFCAELVQRGYQITMITQTPNYPEGRFFEGYSWTKNNNETYHGIDVIRLPVIPRGKSKAMLALNYLSFIVSMCFHSMFSGIEADVVFTYETSPVFVGLYGKWFSRRKGIPHIFYCLDLWPDNFIGVTGVSSPLLIDVIRRITNGIYRSSSKILVSSRAFISKVEKQVSGKDIEYWPQFQDNNDHSIESRVNLPEAFNITFTGNIGEAQGLDILIEVSKLVKENNLNVRFNLIGDGSYLKHLMFKARIEKVDDVLLTYGRVPSREIADILKQSDVALLSFDNSPIFKLTPPAKLQTYMSNSIPILGSCSGEPKSIIEESGSGFVSEAGDSKGLYENIVKFMGLSSQEMEVMGQNGYNYARNNFDKEKLFDRLEEIIEEVTNEFNQ